MRLGAPHAITRHAPALALALALATNLPACRFAVRGLPLSEDGGGAEDGGPALDAAWDAASDAEPAPNGAHCSAARDCQSGFCVEGLCCEEACDPTTAQGLCRACNVPGFEGSCTFAQEGTDPRGQCAESPPSTCGRDGTCDGAGACRLWGSGTACTSGRCAAGVATYPSTCDGQGTCMPPPPDVSCAPYLCADAVRCATTCTTAAQCAPGNLCDNNRCGKRALGQPCAAPSDCQSGFCAQGVCCATDCTGACVSCALAGAVGTCTPIPAGRDPLDQCDAQSRATCGRDGSCDGKGACRLWASGTVCAGAACDGDSLLSARTCDGKGVCLAPRTTSCGAYTCATALRRCYGPPCVGNFMCAAGRICKSNGKCN